MKRPRRLDIRVLGESLVYYIQGMATLPLGVSECRLREVFRKKCFDLFMELSAKKAERIGVVTAVRLYGMLNLCCVESYWAILGHFGFQAG